MAGKMLFGLCAINLDTYTNPDIMIRTAKIAEDSGIESLWVVEHIVLTDPRRPPSPMDPEDSILDPLISLAFAAASTKTIKLGTGIIVLPLRNPLVLAKQLSSLDVLSNGRLIFGLGVGYVEAEFQALGIPFEHRGSRADEYLAAMRSLWNDSKPEYHGRFISFEGIQARPRPIQQPSIEVVVGGRTPEAYRRAVKYANGFYGYGLDLKETEERLNGLRKAAELYPRPSYLGELQITITPDRFIDVETAEKYSNLGVNRLNLDLPNNPTPAGLERFFMTVSKSLIGQV